MQWAFCKELRDSLVEMESGCTGDSVVRLGTNQFIPELQVTANLAEETLVSQPRQRFRRLTWGEVDGAVKAYFSQSASKHCREIERCTNHRFESTRLSLEYCANRARYADGRSGLGIESFEISQ